MDTHNNLAIRLVKLWYHFTGIFFILAAVIVFQAKIYLLFGIFLLLALERLGNMRDVAIRSKEPSKPSISKEDE